MSTEEKTPKKQKVHPVKKYWIHTVVTGAIAIGTMIFAKSEAKEFSDLVTLMQENASKLTVSGVLLVIVFLGWNQIKKLSSRVEKVEAEMQDVRDELAEEKQARATERGILRAILSFCRGLIKSPDTSKDVRQVAETICGIAGLVENKAHQDIEDSGIHNAVPTERHKHFKHDDLS